MKATDNPIIPVLIPDDACARAQRQISNARAKFRGAVAATEHGDRAQWLAQGFEAMRDAQEILSRYTKGVAL
jgi:hypothetical protein